MSKSASTLTKADYEALAAFRYTLRRYLHFADEGAREAGITPQQHQLLLAVKGQVGKEWATISELAECLQIRHHAAVGLVDRGEYAGLVVRQANPQDRRQVRVSLTTRGEELLAQLSQRNLAELRTLRQALSGMVTE